MKGSGKEEGRGREGDKTEEEEKGRKGGGKKRQCTMKSQGTQSSSRKSNYLGPICEGF